MWQAQELDQKIQDVYKRIQTERKVLEASRILSQATTNPDVLRRNDAAIREAERSISYFEGLMKELQFRKQQQGQRDDHSRSQSFPSQVRGLHYLIMRVSNRAFRRFLHSLVARLAIQVPAPALVGQVPRKCALQAVVPLSTRRLLRHARSYPIWI